MSVSKTLQQYHVVGWTDYGSGALSGTTNGTCVEISTACHPPPPGSTKWMKAVLVLRDVSMMRLKCKLKVKLLCGRRGNRTSTRTVEH